MKVSTASWHYRLQRRVWGKGNTYWAPPRSLCPYFWSTVFAILRCAILYVFAPILATILVVMWAWLTINTFVHDWSGTMLKSLVGIFGLATIISFCVTIVYAGESIAAWARRRFIFHVVPKATRPKIIEAPKPHKSPREPGLFLSYLKALKGRICPILEFEGDAE